MKSNISISVVIPCYNSNMTIVRALDSVLSQSLHPNEVVLVDDCGQENLKEYIDSIKDKYNHYFDVKVIISEKNGGAGSARNIGWDNSIGDLIAFLDSDDSWLPEKLEKQIRYFENDKDLEILGANHFVELEDGTLKKEKLVNSSLESVCLSNFKYLIKNRFATSTVVLKRNLNFRFEDGKRYSEDFLLWSQIVLSGSKSLIMTDYVCIYHKPMFGSSGLSSHLSKMIKGELNTYKSLFNQGYYSVFFLIGILIFSYLKYIRRVFISSLR